MIKKIHFCFKFQKQNIYCIMCAYIEFALKLLASKSSFFGSPLLAVL